MQYRVGTREMCLTYIRIFEHKKSKCVRRTDVFINIVVEHKDDPFGIFLSEKLHR